MKKKEEIVEFEDISIEVLRILNAIKHPDVSDQMAESKERIFERINSKIDSTRPVEQPTIKPQGFGKNKFLLYSLSLASCVAILLFSVAKLTYEYGFSLGQMEFLTSEVEISAPLGSTSRVTLSDGTKVILNGGSRLVYPTVFNKDRQVKLSGEGYFDVTKDDEKPFIVHTKNLSAKVLGTRFGFKAYTDDQHTTLTLEEGSVSASPTDHSLDDGVLLTPSQQLIMDNSTKKTQRRNVDINEHLSWKDGILTFRDQTLTEISVILQRRFDITITIRSDKLKEERYTAQFKHGENIEQILGKLSYKRNWNYINRNGLIEIVNK